MMDWVSLCDNTGDVGSRDIEPTRTIAEPSTPAREGTERASHNPVTFEHHDAASSGRALVRAVVQAAPDPTAPGREGSPSWLNSPGTNLKRWSFEPTHCPARGCFFTIRWDPLGILEAVQAGFNMAFITTLFGGLGLVATARHRPAHAARLERLGGMLLVASFVGLGFNLARSIG